MVGEDGVIIVSLDGQWTSDEPDAIAAVGNNLMVKTVKMSSSGVCIRYSPLLSKLMIHISSSLKLLMRISC